MMRNTVIAIEFGSIEMKARDRDGGQKINYCSISLIEIEISISFSVHCISHGLQSSTIFYFHLFTDCQTPTHNEYFGNVN